MRDHLSPDLGGHLGVVEGPVLLETVEAGADMIGDGAELVILQMRPDFAAQTQGTF